MGNKLPSRFDIGESVTLKFGEISFEGCIIGGVHFTRKKVNYDVLVPLMDGEWTVIESVDSICVCDEITVQK